MYVITQAAELDGFEYFEEVWCIKLFCTKQEEKVVKKIRFFLKVL